MTAPVDIRAPMPPRPDWPAPDWRNAMTPEWEIRRKVYVHLLEKVEKPK